jgi:hypothetical protein
MQDPIHNYHVRPEFLPVEFHACTITQGLVTVGIKYHNPSLKKDRDFLDAINHKCLH